MTTEPRADSPAATSSDPRNVATGGLDAWRSYDLAHALHAVDREAILASDAPRALVLDLLARPVPSRDLYNACARLGRFLADAGASPSLAVATIDGAVRALASAGVTCEAAHLPAARASVAEGYVAVIVEAERLAARATWEYPACAVRVSKDTVAIAASYPEGDADALADWSARVALSVSKDGYRGAIVSGSGAAKSEVVAALKMVGIELREGVAAKGWLDGLLGR